MFVELSVSNRVAVLQRAVCYSVQDICYSFRDMICIISLHLRAMFSFSNLKCATLMCVPSFFMKYLSIKLAPYLSASSTDPYQVSSVERFGQMATFS